MDDMQHIFTCWTVFHYEEHPTRSAGACVPGVGIEPTRYCYHWCLRPTRLPIPPPRQIVSAVIPDTPIFFYGGREWIRTTVGGFADPSLAARPRDPMAY